MRKSLTISLAAVTALVAATAAYAQAEPRPEPRDGPRPAMTRADVEQRTTEMFGRMDINDDGVLNQADREAAHRQAFDKIDADKDGMISFAEYQARGDDRREDRAERGGPDAEGRGFGFGHRGARSDHGLARTADADQDGTVTQAEFTTAALTRFDKADTNSDGTISNDERRGARGQMGRHWRHGRGAGDAS
jgi:Ca2+-binding EF-hand superfamily protein